MVVVERGRQLRSLEFVQVLVEEGATNDQVS